MQIYNTSVGYEKKLPDGLTLTSEYTSNEFQAICEKLIRFNVESTAGLLKKPGVDIELFLRDGEKLVGAISCDTYNLSMHIDVMWLDEEYRGRGYGKVLISQAEKMGKEKGCLFSHTNTFSYQAPEFYKACGYEVFAELDEFPDGIIQYFLKKRL